MVLFKDIETLTPEELDDTEIIETFELDGKHYEATFFRVWKGIRTEHLRIDGLQDYISGLEHQIKEQTKRIDALEIALKGHKDCISAHDFNIGGNQKPKDDDEDDTDAIRDLCVKGI